MALHGPLWLWGGPRSGPGSSSGGQAKVSPQPWQEPYRRAVSWFLTLQFVCITWILFRAPNFSTAWLMLRRYLFLDHGGPEMISAWVAWVGPILLVIEYLVRRVQLQTRVCGLRLPAFALAYGACWALAIALLPLGYKPFIYFQF